MELAISLKELAERVGCSVELLHKMRREGRGPNVIKLGTRTVIRIQEAQRWLASMEQDTTGAGYSQSAT
jgi:hypothetical protein